jgi:hypothetical protein
MSGADYVCKHSVRNKEMDDYIEFLKDTGGY